MGLKTQVAWAAKTSLLNKGVFSGKRTDKKDLIELIGALRPQDCGVGLIRVGASGDGGYLIPDDLDGIEYCFSPGVSTISDFENQLADRGIRSFLADYSVDSPAVMRPEFTFDKKFLGASDRDEFLTLETWKDKYLSGYSGDLLLQMDIEGAEYEVILNASDALLNQFRIVVIEFHHLERLFDSFSFRIVSACLFKLLKSFCVVHIHPNNMGETVRSGGIEIPQMMEFTFYNRKRITGTKPQLAYPHAFDEDNFARLRPLKLPGCWFRPE